MKNKTLNYLFGAILLVLLFAVVIAVVSGQGGAERETINLTATDDVSISVTQTLESINKTAIAANISTQTASAPQPTMTSASSPTPTAFVVPDSFYITGIFGSRQYFALGCEASAAADWADFFDVLIYEYDFQHQLPLSDNPDLGFVGDAKGPWGQVPPYAYGVHAEPVAALLREYGLPAVGGKGFTLEQVHEKISQSKPIIAWVIGNMTGGVPAEYTDKEGNKTTVAAYEHVVILTGYDQDSIRYMNNGKFYEVPNEVFLNSWGVLGNMAVMHE